jgi:hypothetical protein
MYTGLDWSRITHGIDSTFSPSLSTGPVDSEKAGIATLVNGGIRGAGRLPAIERLRLDAAAGSYRKIAED